MKQDFVAVITEVEVDSDDEAGIGLRGFLLLFFFFFTSYCNRTLIRTLSISFSVPFLLKWGENIHTSQGFWEKEC